MYMFSSTFPPDSTKTSVSLNNANISSLFLLFEGELLWLEIMPLLLLELAESIFFKLEELNFLESCKFLDMYISVFRKSLKFDILQLDTSNFDSFMKLPKLSLQSRL